MDNAIHENKISETSVRAKTNDTASLVQHLTTEPCSLKCRICKSENLADIHRLRFSDGLGYHDLSAEIKKNFGENFSKDALFRHFKKYQKKTLVVASEKMLQAFDEKTETLALHQKQTLFVMKKSFEKIMYLIDAGALIPTISEWLALQKHYYQVLQDPDHGVHDDVVAIFQRAAEKHGFSLDQAVLFKSGNKRSTS